MPLEHVTIPRLPRGPPAFPELSSHPPVAKGNSHEECSCTVLCVQARPERITVLHLAAKHAHSRLFLLSKVTENLRAVLARIVSSQSFLQSSKVVPSCREMSNPFCWNIRYKDINLCPANSSDARQLSFLRCASRLSRLFDYVVAFQWSHFKQGER